MTTNDGTDGRHCILWTTSEGIFIAIAAWKVGRGPFRNMVEATDEAAKDMARPFALDFKFAEDIPEAYWPAKAKSRPAKVQKAKRRKAKPDDSLFEETAAPAKPEPKPTPAPEPEPAAAPPVAPLLKKKKLLL